MKEGLLAVLVVVCALASSGCMSERYAQRSRGPGRHLDTLGLMTNQDVVSMARGGIADSVIIQLIGASGSAFRLLPRDVTALADSGVGSAVIAAMIRPGTSSHYENNSWGYYYPPYYWYAGFPYWYSWYPSLYLGFAAGYFPLYSYGYFSAPYHRLYGGYWHSGAGARGG
jgi:hypothetical protein